MRSGFGTKGEIKEDVKQPSVSSIVINWAWSQNSFRFPRASAQFFFLFFSFFSFLNASSTPWCRVASNSVMRWKIDEPSRRGDDTTATNQWKMATAVGLLLAYSFDPQNRWQRRIAGISESALSEQHYTAAPSNASNGPVDNNHSFRCLRR